MTATAGQETSRDSGARSGRARFRPLIAALPALVLAAVALWEVGASLRAGGDTGDDDEWHRAADYVRAQFAPGDLIVFAPDWIDPVGRLHLGDKIPLEAATRMNADRYRRIWEVSIRGERSRDTAGLGRLESKSFGDVDVRLYQGRAVDIVTDLVAAFGGARYDGKHAQMPQLRIEEVGFEPHRCVRITPMPDKISTVIYPSVEVGSKLVGYVGLADVFTRRDVRDPGRLDVFIDGEKVASTTVGVDDGWVRFEAETTPKPAAEVRFSGKALGPKAVLRHICYAAELRR